MKNREKYYDEIVEVFSVKRDIAGANCKFRQEKVLKSSCANPSLSCEKCGERVKNWLEQEYIEPIKLTKAEKVILENIDVMFKWIVRSKNGFLSLKEYKPTKENTTWFNKGWDANLPFTHLFKFIKWEDEKAHNIKELLENCEVVEKS